MLDEKERKVLLETKIRNLKRRHAKFMQHADLTDEALEVGREIKACEAELKMLQ